MRFNLEDADEKSNSTEPNDVDKITLEVESKQPKSKSLSKDTNESKQIDNVDFKQLNKALSRLKLETGSKDGKAIHLELLSVSGCESASESDSESLCSSELSI